MAGPRRGIETAGWGPVFRIAFYYSRASQKRKEEAGARKRRSVLLELGNFLPFFLAAQTKADCKRRRDSDNGYQRLKKILHLTSYPGFYFTDAAEKVKSRAPLKERLYLPNLRTVSEYLSFCVFNPCPEGPSTFRFFSMKSGIKPLVSLIGLNENNGCDSRRTRWRN